MVYVTGDIHRDDTDRLLAESWPEGQGLSRDDYLVVCGDFGGIWSADDRDDEVLGWWDRQPWTTLFVDGNHENHDAIDAMGVTARWGGSVHIVPGHEHVIHLMRGEVYDIPDTPGRTVRVLAFGGARSRDRTYRTEGVNWWEREMPSEEEYDRCTANLEKVGWKVDYVLTHELPADLRSAIGRCDYAELAHPDLLQNHLQWVYDRLDSQVLRMWYAGHYHVDMMVSEKVRIVHRDIARMDGSPRAAL